MKIIIPILSLFLLIGCNLNDNKKSPTVSNEKRDFSAEAKKKRNEEVKDIPEKEYPVDDNCGSLDFMKLKDSELQADFFSALNGLLKKQYPNNDQEKCNSVDMTPALLQQFLNNVDVSKLEFAGAFSAIYHFNIACPNYIDPIMCEDKIFIQYFKNTCGFRMIITNSYLVEEGCVGGAQVVYGFEIRDNKIVDFGRQEAR